MTDLILHIGLDKCASSTLQESVFRLEEGFLGTGRGTTLEENLSKQLQLFTPFGGRQWTDKKGLASWVGKVRDRKKERWPNARRLILSNENLSGANRRDDRPILSVLSTLKNEMWMEGRVKVVIVLRNQAARLASGYAQGSSTRWAPSQADFERLVRSRLSSRRWLSLLNYSRWVDCLNEILGEENVLVLLLEETSKIDFWHDLKNFCGLQRFDPEAMLQSNNDRKNVRRIAEARWRISPMDTELLARVQVAKYFNFVWPSQIIPGLRRNFQKRAIGWNQSIHARRASRMRDHERDQEIHLSSDIKAMILNHCGQFNAILARQLGRDIQDLGYWQSSA